MIKGNTNGIKRSILNKLEELKDTTCSGIFDDPTAENIAFISYSINREIAAIVTTAGRIIDIIIGTFDKVNTATAYARSIAKKGLVVIHTHPFAAGKLSEADLSLLSSENVKAVAAIGINDQGKITQIEAAVMDMGQIRREHSPTFDNGFLLSLIKERKAAPREVAKKTQPDIEKAILVAVGSEKNEDFEYNLAELKELCRTAGAQVVGTMTQKKDAAGGAYMLGTGKLSDLGILVQNSGADMVVFDNELSGAQVNNLEKALGVKVIDRSVLILDIFASRAQSQEGKLQVELAQLKYTLPRLIGTGGTMDKSRGGIGLRGPGEKKLETDRRLIKKRINDLEKRLEKLAFERDARRKQRQKNALPTVALVGYTNAGKSTLMNTLSKSDVLAEDKLFATLDPVTRKVYSDGNYYFLTDTVGFINKLPHQFIEAFASTLEEAANADLLLNVIDLSSPYLITQTQVVRDTLSKIGAGDKPVINVFNKIDLAADTAQLPEGGDNLAVSAKHNINIDKLKDLIRVKLFG